MLPFFRPPAAPPPAAAVLPLSFFFQKLAAKMSLARNDMLSTGGKARRQRGYVRVNEPPYGFFIAGSSIEGMNGVYCRKNAPRVRYNPTEPQVALYYEHEDGLWHMALNQLPGAEEEEDDDDYYYSPYKEKKPTHEWVFKVRLCFHLS